MGVAILLKEAPIPALRKGVKVHCFYASRGTAQIGVKYKKSSGPILMSKRNMREINTL